MPLVGIAPTIPRHRTAMSRPELSRPLRLALDAGLIEENAASLITAVVVGTTSVDSKPAASAVLDGIPSTVLPDNGRQLMWSI